MSPFEHVQTYGQQLNKYSCVDYFPSGITCDKHLYMLSYIFFFSLN